MILQKIALLSSSFFCVSALYISFVENPARLKCKFEHALNQWRESYKRALVIQIIMLFISTISSILCWYNGYGLSWLIASFFIFLSFPFTFIYIMPVNKRLNDKNIDVNSIYSQTLLGQWGFLHLFRSIFSLISVLIMISSI